MIALFPDNFSPPAFSSGCVISNNQPPKVSPSLPVRKETMLLMPLLISPPTLNPANAAPATRPAVPNPFTRGIALANAPLRPLNPLKRPPLPPSFLSSPAFISSVCLN